MRLIEKWSNTAAQSHFLCGGGLNIVENNCGVWSHDRREKSFSATLNSHLASADLALILAGGICCKEVEGSCSWLLDMDEDDASRCLKMAGLIEHLVHSCAFSCPNVLVMLSILRMST